MLNAALKMVDNPMFSPPQTAGRPPAHEFFPSGYSGGIVADFSPKTNTFPDRRGGEVMTVFRIEKTRDYTVLSKRHLRRLKGTAEVYEIHRTPLSPG